ncbi:hypothetical protein ASG47_14235 [Devosia sp. Leaf420]|uniref:hypothetical protein n=1 Tax=Devosia sp. Leaf420 TaxID=1736374 RepID=UPI0007124B7C|nr:hypothetical protein [Devosia sp. Leaf420]KQT46088.1 hypothetical protein ASG47_14235 [Devosia sp. Leaf420]
MLRSVLGYIGAIKWSVLAFVLFLIGGFASLGMLGMALYGVVFPVVSMFYPPLDDWNGPWVWPVLIAVGLIWPFSFLVAGPVGYALKQRGVGDWPRRRTYLVILWIGAVVSWLIVLATSFPG